MLEQGLPRRNDFYFDRDNGDLLRVLAVREELLTPEPGDAIQADTLTFFVHCARFVDGKFFGRHDLRVTHFAGDRLERISWPASWLYRWKLRLPK